jgi:transposase-like protein
VNLDQEPTGAITRATLRGRNHPATCRWYLRYSLSYRDLEEITAERGLSVDLVRIWSWAQRFAPILNQRLRRERRPNRSWRVDETYVRVAGQLTYLYRAVDSSGDAIDFMLPPKRELTAAKLAFGIIGKRDPATGCKGGWPSRL